MRRQKAAATEAVVNTASGFVISNLIAYFILPYWGFHRSITNSVEVTIIFTVVSVIRNFSIRIIFDKINYKHSFEVRGKP